MPTWLRRDAIRDALVLDEVVDASLVAHVVSEGYAPDLTDEEVVKLGRDPFLIAYGLASIADRCIVTTEVSKPSRTRANRRVPDVCRHFGIRPCDAFAFFRALNFSTGWRRT